MKVQGSRFKVQCKPVVASGRLSLITNHSRGFSLIECLVYISLFALFINLVMSAYVSAHSASENLRRTAEDITRALDSGERWREDVRTATAPPRLITENGQTWLALPHGTNTIFYTHFGSAVWRLNSTNAAWQPVLTRVQASLMEADARAHVTAWRWEVELQMKDDKKHTRPLFTFLAPAATEKKP